MLLRKKEARRLKSWLLNARPDAQLMEHRQSFVHELKDHSVFRDKLQLLSAFARISTRTNAAGCKSLELENTRRLDRAKSDQRSSLLPTVIFLIDPRSAEHRLRFALELRADSANLALHVSDLRCGAMIMKQSRIATAWDELQDLEKTLTHFKVVLRYLESR